MKIRRMVLAGVICISAFLMACNGKNSKDGTLSFSQEGGIYSDAFSLEITYTGKGDIYYTTDGSDPAVSDTAVKYSSKIDIKDRTGDKNVVSAVDTSDITSNFSNDGLECYIDEPSDDAVDKCTVVRAAVKRTDGTFTESVGNTYFIGSTSDHIQGITESCKAAGTDLAVINISMNFDDLFNSATGIYVKGDIFTETYKNTTLGWGEDVRKLAANYSQRGKDWERDAHIDFFEMNSDSGELVLSQNCGIRIQGNYSRSDLQKGFRLYAREEYGDKNFNYAIWGDDLKDSTGETLDKVKTFVLRAGGNCAFTSKYNDIYWQTLAADMNCSTKASRPCVVYLNGEYWGLYILEEDYSDNYFEYHYGVDNNEVVVYKGDAETYECGYKLDEGTLPEGETDDGYYFDELFSFFNNHKNLESQEDYDEFAKLVDVNSVMDYFAMEVWINNKWDWPGKNWSMWKTASVDESNEYADGRWRFCFYDVEFGGVSGSSDAYANTIKEDNYEDYGLLDFSTDNPAVLCFAYLMTNKDFRDSYCDRLLSLSDNVFEKTNALDTLESFENIYGPLFEQFFARYPGTGSKDEALNGGYASSKCIRDFLNKREDYIQPMVDWVDRHFS